MSDTPEPTGLVINTKTISFIAGLIGLISVFYYAVSYLNGQESRVALLEQRMNGFETRTAERDKYSREDNKILIDKIDKLQEQVTRLAFALKGEPK